MVDETSRHDLHPTILKHMIDGGTPRYYFYEQNLSTILWIQYIRFPIKFKHIVAFTDKAKTVLYFFQEQLKSMKLLV